MQGIETRKTVLNLLLAVDRDGAYSNLALKEALGSGGYGSRDAAFITGLFYGTLENILRIDYIIGLYARGRRLHRVVRCALRMGVQQMLFMRVPESAAIDTSVELVRLAGKRQLCAFTNAVLRKVAQNRENIPYPDPEKDPVRYLSVMYSCPQDVTAMWLETYGFRFTQDLAAYAAVPGTTTVRTNLLKTTAPQLSKELMARGARVERARYFPSALSVRGLGDVTANPLFQQGMFSVMGEASMLAVHALDPRPGQRILDACAAPGGKTAYIAERMENRGRLYAWDRHPHRVRLAKATLLRLGVPDVELAVRDATRADPELFGVLDGVLVDAPCSGLGVMVGKPDIRLTRCATAIEALAGVQEALLDAVLAYLRPGGALVYCTCTISRAENEEVVARFLEKHRGFEPDDWGRLLPEGIDPARISMGCLQLFPHIDGTDGFFIARLVRRE